MAPALVALNMNGDLLCVDILAEPRGQVYERLVEHVASRTQLLLVVLQSEFHGQFWVDERAKEVLRRLGGYLIYESRQRFWPGTGSGRAAAVYYYPCVPEVIRVVREAATGLYQWRQPSLPDDLSFLRPNGDCWLVTISHEHDAYLVVTREELAELVDNVPGLALGAPRPISD